MHRELLRCLPDLRHLSLLVGNLGLLMGVLARHHLILRGWLLENRRLRLSLHFFVHGDVLSGLGVLVESPLLHLVVCAINELVSQEE
mmetsp:Transcript_12536/g.16053  ORF Transcript_12536/g.16053 Transcript_12536/m.16053 type:complete len:87 (-) Transcript_12536:2017-2277(-)